MTSIMDLNFQAITQKVNNSRLQSIPLRICLNKMLGYHGSTS